MSQNNFFEREESTEDERTLLDSIDFKGEHQEGEFFTDIFENEKEDLPDQYPSHMSGEDKDEEKKEGEEITESDLLMVTAERRAATVAQQVARRETIASLHDEDLISEILIPQIVGSEELEQDIEERASKLLSEQEYVQNEELSDIMSTAVDEEVEGKLNDEGYITDKTKIPAAISEFFGISKNSFSELNSKMEKLINIQRLQLESRERSILTENIASVLFGIGLILFSFGFWQVSDGIVSLLLRVMFSAPLGILGIGLLSAGGMDLINKYKEND